MKRYSILKNIYDFLQAQQGYEPKEYILFKKQGVGHISIKMTNREEYELVSYNEKTDVFCGVNGHTEEFIDKIMQGQASV